MNHTGITTRFKTVLWPQHTHIKHTVLSKPLKYFSDSAIRMFEIFWNGQWHFPYPFLCCTILQLNEPLDSFYTPPACKKEPLWASPYSPLQGLPPTPVVCTCDASIKSLLNFMELGDFPRNTFDVERGNLKPAWLRFHARDSGCISMFAKV